MLQGYPNLPASDSLFVSYHTAEMDTLDAIDQDRGIRILVIEDHQDIIENIADYLEPRGYLLDFAYEGIGGLHLALTENYDVIVLDIMLPGMDGLILCRKLRQEAKNTTPVLMLTARDTLPDKLEGFNAGADDYLIKPFALQELEARVNALVRREFRSPESVLRLMDLELDLGTMKVRRAGKAIELNRACLKILEILLRASPNMVSRKDLEYALWGDMPRVAMRFAAISIPSGVKSINLSPFRYFIQSIVWGTDWVVCMKFQNSLRFRIVITFCLFGTILCTLYGIWMVLAMTNVEDELFYRQLQLEIEHVMLNYQHDHRIPQPRFPFIRSFLGTDGMADYEKELVKGRGDGLYEDNDKDIHFAVKTLPNIGKTLYLIYDVSSLEIHEQLNVKRIVYNLAGLLLVAIVGALLGILTSRKIIAPIIQLADHVKKAGLEKIPEDLSKRFYSDEVGVLAQTFEQSMKRIEAFIEREKLFTRDASHELRTPITVILGAVEVLQQNLGKMDVSILRPLQRIEKAAKDMKSTVESFLWLARGEETIDPGQTCDIVSIVKKTMKWHQNEVEAKQITLNLICQGRPTIISPPHIAQVIFSNLLRNALSFTSSGTITVSIEEDYVEISDTGEGIPEYQLDRITQPYERSCRSSGFGIGLDIVQRLCNRFGWKLEIESQLEHGTTVRWVFNPGIQSY